MSKIKVYKLPKDQLYPECVIDIEQKRKRKWEAEISHISSEGINEIEVLKNLIDKLRIFALLIEEEIEKEESE